MNNEKLEAALKYAARGWRVFPLLPNTKRPAICGWDKDATTEGKTICEWWKQTPEANVAILCGAGDCGPYVVDIDAPKGGHKSDGAASLAAAGITLPPTLTAITPNEGRHLYFGLLTPPKREQIHTGANINGLLGVDIRAAGGYIVAPPSTIDGKAYKWTNYDTTRFLADYPSALHWKEQPKAEPAPLPAVRVESRTDATERARLYLNSCDPAISGQGGHNATLHAAHSLVVGFGLDDQTALGLLLAEYNPRCVPPWTERELRHKVESARKNPQKPVGHLLAESRTPTPSPALPSRAPSPSIGKPDDLADRYSRRCLLSDFSDPLPEDKNPDALFRNGWLRRGGGALFISVSGAGKSVASTQFCDAFAIGREWFGIAPLRPLKIAVYQAEDDKTEVADFRNNIRRGFIASSSWTAEDIAQAENNITYHDVTGLAGASFVQFVKYAQERDKADLLLFNPLQSFAGCDIANNAEVSDFLRVQLNPILANPSAPCGCVIIHHTNKVPTNAKDRKAWLDTNSAAYAGAGGAELVNWARAILTLRPHESVGFYDLIAAKRGKRLGWKDADGNPALVKTIAHSEGLMFWREVPPDELASVEAGLSHIDDERRRRVVQLVEDNGNPFSSEAELVKAIELSKIGGATTARAIIRECVKFGELVKRARTGTNAKSIYTPGQWADESCPRFLNDVRKDGEKDDDELPFD